MSVEIHKLAVVSPKAQLGENVKVGPNCVVNDGVVIGDGTVLMANCYIDTGTTIGKDCKIFPGAVVGTEPQDMKFEGEITYTQIGDRTTLREFSTIHRGTNATGLTSVGSDSLIMAYCHVAHDCRVGNHVIMSNVVQLAGHVIIEDWVVLGGVAKVHQYVTIGCHAMVGADVKVVMDVAPYVLIGRNPPRVEKINKVGLRRRGFSDELIREIQDFYDLLLFSGMNNKDGIDEFMKRGKVSPEVMYCIDFIQKSTRGIHR